MPTIVGREANEVLASLRDALGPGVPVIVGGASPSDPAEPISEETILKGAARTLDLTRPVAILLIAVLHFIPDADDPHAIVARLMDAVPSGSYLIMAHAASDIAPEASAEMARRYNAMSSASITPRNRDQVARFFDGLDLLPPGLVPISQWGLSGQIDPTAGGLVGYCAIARKP